MNEFLIVVCVSAYVLLFIGALAASFAAGVLFGRSRAERSLATENDVPEEPGDELEMRKLKEEKERQEAQLRAFQQLLDYNPEIAYGLGRALEDTDEK